MEYSKIEYHFFFKKSWALRTLIFLLQTNFSWVFNSYVHNRFPTLCHYYQQKQKQTKQSYKNVFFLFLCVSWGLLYISTVQQYHGIWWWYLFVIDQHTQLLAIWILNGVCITKKQQIQMPLSLVWPIWGSVHYLLHWWGLFLGEGRESHIWCD